MTQNPLNPPVSPDKALKPITGEEGMSAEDQLGMQLPSAPFSLKGQASTGTNQGQISPMDLSSASASAPKEGLPTPNDLVSQAQQISNQMNNAKQQLQTPGLEFRPSTTDILNQHLNRVSDNLSVISNRLNLPTRAVPSRTGSESPIQYFLNLLTGSQEQLSHISDSITHPPSGQLTTGDLLAVQVKMTGVQQQMEFFGVLIGKMVENFKTIMNIQS